jgi:hypothetical protein
MNNAPGLQSTVEGIFTLNLITVIEELIRAGYVACPPCPPCSRTEAKMNAQLDAKADSRRVAVITDDAFIRYIFKQAFPNETYPINEKYDPRIIAITAAVKKMKTDTS